MSFSAVTRMTHFLKTFLRRFLYHALSCTFCAGLLNLVVLRVAAPRIPSVGVLVPRLQADEPPVGSSGINIALRQRRLKRDRRLHRVGKTDAAIALVHGNEMTIRSSEIQIVAAHRRRRENLPARR